MPQVMVECTDLNDWESMEAAMAEKIGQCNVTYYNQAIALIESGRAETITAASRKISDDTGESPEAVRHRIRKGGVKLGLLGQRPSIVSKPKRQSSKKLAWEKVKNDLVRLEAYMRENCQLGDEVEKHRAAEIKSLLNIIFDYIKAMEEE